MAWPKSTHGQLVRLKRQRDERMAKMARGKATVDISPAAYYAVESHVSDHAWVEDHSLEVLEEAKRRTVWAHRLAPRPAPFMDIVLNFERAVDAQDEQSVTWAILRERQRRAQERRDKLWRPKQNLKKIKAVKEVKTTPTPQPRKRGRPTKEQQFKATKQLKQRTREQRIADLHRALEKQ